MKIKRRKFSLSLSSLSILSITAASAVAVSVCIFIFASVYSNALLKDAKLSSGQTLGQIALAVNNNLDSMRQKLEFIEETVGDCSDVEDFYNKISVISRMQRDIYAVTVYDENGDIIAATNGETPIKKQIYKDLSFEKSLFALLPAAAENAFEEILFAESLEDSLCEYANCPKMLKIAIIVKIIRFKDVSFFIS